MSIESPFYGENIQTMFKLGRAQGVAIAAAMSNNVKVFEYTPRQIKQSITGNGNASKEQVAKMILYLLNTKTNIETMDETDAIAIALTHYFQKDRIVSKNNYSNWNDFIKQNPNKIK
jgi:crossover junction endodeoxyribonuclease RuvC